VVRSPYTLSLKPTPDHVELAGIVIDYEHHLMLAERGQTAAKASAAASSDRPAEAD
jgi:hypothetical protein